MTKRQIIVSSQDITINNVERFLYLAKASQGEGCKVTVITTEPQYIAYRSPKFCQELINTMWRNGIHVIIKEDRFSVLDDGFEWYGDELF